jgi:hypothetical protein
MIKLYLIYVLWIAIATVVVMSLMDLLKQINKRK